MAAAKRTRRNRVSMRITDDLLTKIDAIAIKHDRSRSHVIEQILRVGLKMDSRVIVMARLRGEG